MGTSCVCVQVHMSSQRMCRSWSTPRWSLFSPTVRSGDWTEVVGLGGKHFNLLGLLANPIPRSGILHQLVTMISILRDCQTVPQGWLHILTLSPQPMRALSSVFSSLPTPGTSCLILTVPVGVKWNPIAVLNCVCLMNNDVEIYRMCMRNICSYPLPTFKLG